MKEVPGVLCGDPRWAPTRVYENHKLQQQERNRNSSRNDGKNDNNNCCSSNERMNLLSVGTLATLDSFKNTRIAITKSESYTNTNNGNNNSISIHINAFILVKTTEGFAKNMGGGRVTHSPSPRWCTPTPP